MAFVHGKDSAFLITDSSDAEQDLSAYVDNVSDNVNRALSEVTAFGDEGTRNIPGLQNATVSISGHWDPTQTTGPHAVLSGLLTHTSTSTWQYGPGGSSSGAVKLTGQCWITSYSITSSVSDKVSFSAELQVDGTVTFDTFT